MTSTLSLPRTERVLQQGMAEQIHLGAQLCVYQNDQPLIDLALGHARPEEPLTSDHLLRWMSAGKPLTAIAVAQLYEQGQLALDDPVARFIPEFAAHDKQNVTLDHLLTHTVSFPDQSVRFDIDWKTTIDDLCDSPLEPGFELGQMAAYQPLGTWFILGEIIQRITSRPLSEHLRDCILVPTGMNDSWLGMPESQYDAYAHRLAPLYDTRPDSTNKPIRHTRPEIIPPNPGSNATGPIRELARFYQMLLNAGRIDNQRIVNTDTLESFTGRTRVDLYDRTMQHKLDWGRGFAVNSAHHGSKTVPYSFGPYASPITFGHGGMQSSIGFADPRHQIAVAYVCNGLPGEPTHHKRNNAILKALYEDLEFRD